MTKKRGQERGAAIGVFPKNPRPPPPHPPNPFWVPDASAGLKNPGRLQAWEAKKGGKGEERKQPTVNL